MAVNANLLPTHSEKTLGAMKAERTVKRITFNPTMANPGEILYVSVPRLNKLMRSSCPARLPYYSTSILPEGTRITISCKTYPGHSLTGSL